MYLTIPSGSQFPKLNRRQLGYVAIGYIEPRTHYLKGPRTQMLGFRVPNTIQIRVFGP